MNDNERHVVLDALTDLRFALAQFGYGKTEAGVDVVVRVERTLDQLHREGVPDGESRDSQPAR